MADQEDNQNRWEEAYLLQSHDAHVGRLMSGLLHNLNGVVQAYSMQSDLLAMMFPKADTLLTQLEESFDESPPGELSALRELLQSRASLIDQALEKVRTGQEILRRIPPLATFQKSSQSGELSVNDTIKAIIEFQCGDSFFKHKVEKELILADNLPCFIPQSLVVYQVLSAVIENAIEVMKDSTDSPNIRIETKAGEGEVILAIQDSGPGISEQKVPSVFEPFYTTKENHAGLGLFLAKKNIEKLGGHITCHSSPGATRFQMSFPCQSK